MSGTNECIRGFHMMAKPVGPLCNLNCKYCFYLEKKALYHKKENYLMTPEVLEAFIAKYIKNQQLPEIQFVWQGGEPMLAGIDYYRLVVLLQKKYANGKRIINSIQTNGTLIDEQWCEFFKENNFMVGLSLDGPEEIHDLYRRDFNDKPTFKKVMNGLKLLQKHNIEYNVLACVADKTCEYPVKIYKFFKDIGVKYIQFTPIVERIADEECEMLGLKNAMPTSNSNDVTSWTVNSRKYGEFLIKVFDEWVKEDVGDIFIMNFEWALTSWIGLENTVCIFTQKCGDCSIIEHNGDIFSCDHYMYPQYKIGNILKDNPSVLMNSKKQQDFGEAKKDLPKVCLNCEVLFACRGECPRHRFGKIPHSEDMKSYLCEGYKAFFYHINPYMKAMVKLIENGRPVSDVMVLKDHPIVLIK